MNSSELVFFSVFILLVLTVLLLDLGVFDRKNHVVRFKEALIWTIVWISVSFLFSVLLYFKGHLLHMGNNPDLAGISKLVDLYGHPVRLDNLDLQAALKVYNHNLALEYITGYLIEKALSVDNIFVMVMIFYAFRVDPRYYRRVLFWGILAAVVLRFIFIFSASVLILKFDWVLLIFGLFLIYSGISMFINRQKTDRFEADTHPVVRFVSKYFPVYPTFARHHFFIQKNGKRFITPLFIVLLVIEFSDLIFAVDSIPAIFSVTRDPYVVFFSNIFAILGLRAMFFMLVNVLDLFRYLKTGLAFLLAFIGVKLVFHTWLVQAGFKTIYSFYAILLILSISVIASLIFPEKKKPMA